MCQVPKISERALAVVVDFIYAILACFHFATPAKTNTYLTKTVREYVALFLDLSNS